jgi:hypothetical protein
VTRTIKGVALGTYYAVGAAAAEATPGSSAMRGLVYAVKNNRPTPNRPQAVDHPFHSAPHAVRVDRDNAIPYVTAIVGRLRASLLSHFGVDDAGALTLVPVPSSTVTSATIETDRFPTLQLCRALAGAGLGTVALLAVQREPVEPRTKGNRRDVATTLANLIRTASPMPRHGSIVLVDDNVRTGASIVAVDMLLGATATTVAFAVAVTDRQACESALLPRRFTLAYEPDERSPSVDRSVSPPRARRR